MSTTTSELLAASSDLLNVTAAFVAGLFIAGALIWAFWFGMRVRDRESPRPRPDEQPTLPSSGPVHEVREMREPDEMPRAAQERERLMPHELHHASTKRRKDQQRGRWDPGSSGSFGSGGLGRH